MQAGDDFAPHRALTPLQYVARRLPEASPQLDIDGAREKQARRASLAIGKAKAPEVQPVATQESLDSVSAPRKGRSSIGLRI